MLFWIGMTLQYTGDVFFKQYKILICNYSDKYQKNYHLLWWMNISQFRLHPAIWNQWELFVLSWIIFKSVLQWFMQRHYWSCCNNFRPGDGSIAKFAARRSYFFFWSYRFLLSSKRGSKNCTVIWTRRFRWCVCVDNGVSREALTSRSLSLPTTPWQGKLPRVRVHVLCNVWPVSSVMVSFFVSPFYSTESLFGPRYDSLTPTNP